MSADQPQIRLGILGIVAASLLAVLLARLAVIQVVANDEYVLAAQENTIRTVTVSAPRGRILDRNGNVLVENRGSPTVFVDESKLDDDERPALLERLSPILGVPAETLAARLDDPRSSPYRPVAVASDVDETILVRLRERRAEFPAVVADTVPVRRYPNGTLAAHALGYVGEVNEAELAATGDQYELGDLIGKAGIELVYEADLRGVDGELEVEVDADGVPLRTRVVREPVQGDDVVLSIDIEAQRAAETSLAEGLEAARGRRFRDTGERFVANAGSVVVLDSIEGSVVAMASYPTYDPSILVDGISQPEYEDLTDPALGAPFTNRATQGEYAPGSTWKLVTGLAALRHGLVTPQTTFDDRGVYELPDCRGIGCRRQNAGATPYGPVAMAEALTVSSDIYFYDLGYRFWVGRSQFGDSPIQDLAAELGFGADTGVQLSVENDGLVVTPESKQRQHDDNPEAFPEREWYHGDSVNLSIGQGQLTVTPIQLANAYAAFATGTRVAPNLALHVQEPDASTVVREVPRREVATLSLPVEHTLPMLDGLIGVTTRDGGTATNAFFGWPNDVATVAGKTGTAQVGRKQDTAIFVGVAPAAPPPSAPQYSVAVVMEQAGFGATAAAPVARSVLSTLLGVQPPAEIEIAEGGSA